MIVGKATLFLYGFSVLNVSATPLSLGNRAYTLQISSKAVQVYFKKTFVWAYAIPKGHSEEALLTPDKLILVEDEKPRWGDYWLKIYDLKSGQFLIQRTGYGNLSQVFIHSSLLFVQYSGVGGQISTSTLIQDLQNLQKSSTVPGWKIAENESSILFDDTSGNFNPYEAVLLNYYRYDLRSKSISVLHYRIPERNECGSVEKDGTKNEGETFSASEISAVRHDRCGVFKTIFTWK